MAPLTLIFISPFKANFPHKVSAHECFDASKQLNWRVKHLEACEPVSGNETVSETWFLTPIRELQCQTEIGEKAKIETPQNNVDALKCFGKLWLLSIFLQICQRSAKFSRLSLESKDCKYSNSWTVLSDWPNRWRLQDPFLLLKP